MDKLYIYLLDILIYFTVCIMVCMEIPQYHCYNIIILLFIILLGYYFIFSDFICRLYRYLYIFCLDGYYTWTALVLLVESMFSHNFFIVSDIVNASEKQKYISVGRVVG